MILPKVDWVRGYDQCSSHGEDIISDASSLIATDAFDLTACRGSGEPLRLPPARDESPRCRISQHFFQRNQLTTLLLSKVGSGSGYTCAMFHHLVSPTHSDKKGKVVGIDHIQQLVDWSINNLKTDGLQVNSPDAQLEVIFGDGRKGALRRFGACAELKRSGA